MLESGYALRLAKAVGDIAGLELMVKSSAQFPIRVYGRLCRCLDIHLGASLRVCQSPSETPYSQFAEMATTGSNLLFSLTDGGTAGLFWGYTITVIASIFIYLSIGEMASM